MSTIANLKEKLGSKEPEIFEKISRIPCSGAELDAWHRKPGAFDRLTPPWEKMEILGDAPIEEGKQVTLRVRMGPFWKEWVAKYIKVKEGEEFTDVQVEGPFAEWRHRHRFIARGKGEAAKECSLVDEVQYRAPLGPVGKFLGGWFFRRKLERSFRYRHDLTKADIERAKQHPPAAPMRILISGATGLIGRTLIPVLEMQGHTVIRLTRSSQRHSDIEWDPDAGRLDLSAAGKIDAVIHLAGENIAGGRWTKKQKDKLFYSRKRGTRLIADTLAEMVDRPKVLISASGINYYEQNAINTHDEDSPIGTSFLSEVCREWELGNRPAEEAGIRVCKLRIGVVLTPAGGALKKMLLPFKLCAGGPVGSGRQRLSWIAIDDLIDMITRALGDERWSGPVNAVAEEPVTNKEFGKALGRALRRPAFIPAPGFALRLVFGPMVDETILPDLPVYSKRLKEELGYDLRHPELDGALAHLLGAYPKEEFDPAPLVVTPPTQKPLPEKAPAPIESSDGDSQPSPQLPKDTKAPSPP